MKYIRTTGLVLLVIALNAALSLTSCGQEYKKGDEVVVVRDADLKRGTEIVGTVREGEKLSVEQVQGNWLFVRSGGARGWVNIRNVAGKLGGGKAGQSPISLTGPRVAICNLVGNVELVPGTGDSVEVDVQRGGRDAARLRVVKNVIDGRQTLCVIYPTNLVVTPPALFGGITTVRVGQDGSFGRKTGPSARDIVIMGTGSIMSPAPSGPRLEAHAHLTVRVPPERDVDINLGVGNVKARQVGGAVAVNLVSGDVVARGLGKALVIDATSTDIELTDVAGAVTINVTSGDVTAHGLGGALTVKAASSNVDASRVEGPVKIDLSSGDIVAAELQDALSVNSSSSKVEASQIQGPVKLDLSSGDVTVRDVGDTVTIRTSSSEIEARRIKGTVSVNSSSGDVTAHEVDGGLTINSSSTNVEASQIQGPVKISVTSGDATVRDFHNQLEVDTTMGNVTLHVPADFAAKVELDTGFGGDIEVQVPLTESTKEEGRVRGTLGDGSGRIRVHANQGRIRLLPTDEK